MNKITISLADLPEAKNWEDGKNYELDVKQVSHSKGSVTLEIGDAEDEQEEEDEDMMEDDEENGETYSRMEK